MSNETYLTVRGFVGADPTIFRSDTGRTTTVLRVGVTARSFDRSTHTYVDGTTAWYTVRCYGDLGENAARSVKKGFPVVVRGRLSPRTWTDKDSNTRMDFVIAADSLGLDLNTGWVTFQRSRPLSQSFSGQNGGQAGVQTVAVAGAEAAPTPSSSLGSEDGQPSPVNDAMWHAEPAKPERAVEGVLSRVA